MKNGRCGQRNLFCKAVRPNRKSGGKSVIFRRPIAGHRLFYSKSMNSPGMNPSQMTSKTLKINRIRSEAGL